MFLKKFALDSQYDDFPKWKFLIYQAYHFFLIKHFHQHNYTTEHKIKLIRNDLSLMTPIFDLLFYASQDEKEDQYKACLHSSKKINRSSQKINNYFCSEHNYI